MDQLKDIRNPWAQAPCREIPPGRSNLQRALQIIGTSPQGRYRAESSTRVGQLTAYTAYLAVETSDLETILRFSVWEATGTPLSAQVPLGKFERALVATSGNLGEFDFANALFALRNTIPMTSRTDLTHSSVTEARAWLGIDPNCP